MLLRQIKQQMRCHDEAQSAFLSPLTEDVETEETLTDSTHKRTLMGDKDDTLQ